jgi:hypothetical protein
MGSPSPPTTSSNTPNNTAYLYQPTGQGQADQQLQGYFGNFSNPYSPLQGQYAQTAQNLYNNPYAASYQASANQAGQSAQGVGQSDLTAAGNLYGVGNSGLENISSLSGMAAQNTGLNQLVGGSNVASGMLENNAGQTQQNIAGLAGTAGSNYGAAQGALGYEQSLVNPSRQNYGAAQGALGYAQSLASPSAVNYGYASGAAGTLGAGANSILNTAFDPQGALYQQQYQQNQDASQASLAAMGLGTSGAGAGVLGQSQQNFNTNWQNQQLQRQATGLGAAEGAYGQGQAGLNSALSGMQNTGAGIQSGVAGLGNALSGMQNTGAGIQSGVAGLNAGLTGQESAATTTAALGQQAGLEYAQGSSLPATSYQQYLQGQAGLQGALGTAANTYGNLSSTGNSLGESGVGLQGLGGSLGYGAANTIGQNQYGALNPYLQAGVTGQNANNQQIQALLQYLGYGSSASQGLAGAQNQAYNTQAGAYGSTLGGIGSLAGIAALALL